ncbi:O-antigen ligase family protein [Candidatus Microgenomates bacterium]|nr:O-antigen ligase family protein [Candidatus Microgenomates bacterium]
MIKYFVKNIDFFLALATIIVLPMERIGSFDFAGFTIRLSQIFVVALIFIISWRFLFLNKKIYIPKSLIFYLVFLLAGLISLTVAQNLDRGIHVLAFSTFMFFVPFALVSAIDSKQKFNVALAIFLGTTILAAIFGFFQFSGDLLGLPQYLTGLSNRYTHNVFGLPRIQSTFIEPLYFANFLIAPVLIFLSASFFSDEKKNKTWFFIGFLTLLLSLLLTFSKGGIIATTIALIVFLILRAKIVFHKKNYILLLISLLVFFISLFAVSKIGGYSWDKSYEKAYNIIFQGGSIKERQESYAVAIDAFRHNPWVGIGIGNFGPYFSGYPVNVPEAGWPIVNNQYLEILSEIGTIGFLAFLLFIISVFWQSIFSYIRSHDRWIKTLIFALSLSFFAILLQYATFSTIYIMHVWVIIGLILIAQRLSNNEK